MKKKGKKSPKHFGTSNGKITTKQAMKDLKLVNSSSNPSIGSVV